MRALYPLLHAPPPPQAYPLPPTRPRVPTPTNPPPRTCPHVRTPCMPAPAYPPLRTHPCVPTPVYPPRVPPPPPAYPGLHALMRALQLVVTSGLGDCEAQLHDRPHPPQNQPRFTRHPPVSESMARAGLGKAGYLSICGPACPKICIEPTLKHLLLDSRFPCPPSRSPKLLRQMLKAVRVDAFGLRTKHS